MTIPRSKYGPGMSNGVLRTQRLPFFFQRGRVRSDRQFPVRLLLGWFLGCCRILGWNGAGMGLADGRRGTGKGRTGRRSEAAYLLVCSVVVPQEGRWGWAGRTSDADLAGTAGGNFWNWAGPRDATLPRGRTPGASSTRSPEGHCVSLYPPAGPALLWRGPAASLRRGVAAT